MVLWKEVLSKHLSNFEEKDSVYTGYIDGNLQFDTFWTECRTTGYMFVKRNTTKAKGALFFQHKRKSSNVQIPFCGAVYQPQTNMQYECCQGAVRNHERIRAIESKEQSAKKRRVSLQPSKKVNCPAAMHITCITVYPDYNVSSYTPSSKEQTKIIKILKADLAASKTRPELQPASFVRYMISAPKEDAHTHPAISSSITQTLHPELSAEIASLVQRHICSVKEIRSHLREKVRRMVEESEFPEPDPSNRCFYPLDSVIYNHMCQAVFKLSGTTFDQEALEQYITTCQTDSHDHSFYFRPYMKVDPENDAGDGPDTETRAASLLFCHQMNWQKYLVECYGHGVCLLDATYKSTNSGLLLFLLSVKTLVGYSVVGSFIIHSETPELVQEALQVFRLWNPDWQPEYFMTDLSSAEIYGVESAFPNSVVYICPFFRDRAWNSWIHRPEHNVPEDAKDILKELWDNIASAPTDSIFQHNIQILKGSQAYIDNPQVQIYFDELWLPEAHRWNRAYHTVEFLSKVNITDGIETKNKVVNHKYLNSATGRSLCGLVRILVEQYLPDALHKELQHKERKKRLALQIAASKPAVTEPETDPEQQTPEPSNPEQTFVLTDAEQIIELTDPEQIIELTFHDGQVSDVIEIVASSEAEADDASEMALLKDKQQSVRELLEQIYHQSLATADATSLDVAKSHLLNASKMLSIFAEPTEETTEKEMTEDPNWVP